MISFVLQNPLPCSDSKISCLFKKLSAVLFCASVFLLLLFPPSIAGVETNRVLTLLDVISVAMDNHPGILLERQKVQVANQNLKVVDAERNPSLLLTASASNLRQNGNPGGSSLVGDNFVVRDAEGNYYTAGGRFSFGLFEDGTWILGTSSAQKAAMFDLSEVQWESANTIIDLSGKIATDYSTCLQALRDVEALEKIVTSKEKNYLIAISKFENKLISKNDLLSTKVLYEKAKYELDEVKRTFLHVKQQLSAAMGNNEPLDSQLAPFPKITNRDIMKEEAITNVVDFHPKIAAQKSRIQSQSEILEGERKSKYPTLEIRARYYLGNDLEELDKSTQWIYEGGLELRQEFGFGQKNRQISARQEQLKQEERQLSLYVHELKEDVNSIFHEIDLCEKNIELLELLLTQATEEFKLNTALYEKQLIQYPQFDATLEKLERLKADLDKKNLEKKAHFFSLNLLTGSIPVWETTID